MRQFVAPKVLLVDGRPAVCECEAGIFCANCTQANLLLWNRAEGVSIKANGASIIALREAIEKKGIRGVARELGVDHKAVTDWILKKNIPDRYFTQGVLIGKGAVFEG